MTRISFGIIALNAEPFLEYNLRALYPFAHEIIVVEGAVQAAASLATIDGHSVDGTLAMLRDFKQHHDPEDKLRIIVAEDEGYPNGLWPEKDEMSRAYALRLTGDWLWQVDTDEFYKSEDMFAIANMLDSEPSITAVSFPYYEFFGSFESVISGVWHKYEFPLVHRLFRWESGYSYSSHRPVTVLDADGTDLRAKKWLSSPNNGERKIYMYHYSYVFPKQAEQKVGYYSNVEWTQAFRDNKRWMEDSFKRLKKPMFIGEKGWPNLQWLERFEGRHPDQIQQLREDLHDSKVIEPQRPAADIEALLNSPLYSLQRIAARLWLAMYWPIRTSWKFIRAMVLGKSLDKNAPSK